MVNDPAARPPDGTAANVACYGDYYAKPAWWFALRYDTQVKRNTCLALLRRAGVPLRGVRVLDIGFGSGATLFSFPRDARLAGVELSASAVARARDRAARLGYAVAEFHESGDGALPFGDGSQDIVIASHVLEHVRDDQDLLREIRRVLAPSGVAVILVPLNERYADPNHVRQYTSAGLVAAAVAAGFTVVAQLDNERLYHLVEDFYARGHARDWRRLGPLVVAAFNIPSALMPWPVLALVDRMLASAGWLPRQAGVVLRPVPGGR